MFIRERQACDITLLIILCLFILGMTPLLVGYTDHTRVAAQFDTHQPANTSEMTTGNELENYAIYHDPDLKCAYPDRFRWMQPFFTWYEVLQQECDALGKLLV